MTGVFETAVTLRLRGDDLDPDTISGLVGAKPTHAARKNDTWHTPTGKPVTARHGFWHLECKRVRPGDLDAQITEILGQLTGDLAVWQRLTSRYEGELFCGLFLSETNQGIGISPETLTMVGARGLGLDLDIYRRDEPD